MNNIEKLFLKELEENDAVFAEKFAKILNDEFRKISKRPSLKDAQNFNLDDKKIYKLLKKHSAKLLKLGIEHGHIEVIKAKKESIVKLSQSEIYVKPEDALSAIDKRVLKLAGNVSDDIKSKIKDCIRDELVGASFKEIEEKIARLLSSSIDRGELIAITESTWAYNRGRIISFAKDDVEYVQFSAVLDARTSDTCKSRHGLIMRLDDPRLPMNIPPLHGRCRSILKPYFSDLDEKKMNWDEVVSLPKGWSSADKEDFRENYKRPYIAKAADALSSKDMKVIDADLKKLPKEHLDFLEKKGVKFVETKRENSAYDFRSREILLRPGLEKREVAHEVGHAIEYTMNILEHKEFKNALNQFSGVNYKEIEVEQFSSKNKLCIDKSKYNQFMTEYQASLGMDMYDSFNDDGTLNLKALTEYFAEGYSLFYSNYNLRLQEADPLLYNFIKNLKSYIR